MILMLVAIGCGLTAAILVQGGLRANNAGKIKLWVASGDIPPGYQINDVKAAFREQDYLPGTVPEGAFEVTNEQDWTLNMQGKKVMVKLKKDEAVTKKHLEDVYLTKDLLPNERAMTVPVRIDSAGAGFILPGSSVDLITTYTRESGGMVAQVFLQNVRVLAINTETNQPQDGAKTMINPTTATLAVKVEEAARVMLATRLGGQIIMVLRRVGDREIEKDRTKLVLASLTGSGKAADDETEKVLFVKQDLERNTPVTKDLFEEREVPVKTYDEASFVKSLADPMLNEGRIIAVPLKKGTPVAKSFLTALGEKPVKGPAVVPVHTITIRNGSKDPITATFTMSNGKMVGGTGRETTPMPGTSGSEGK